MSDNDLVERLLDDGYSRHVISSDVDDVNLYGSKHRHRVTGGAADLLIQNGLELEIYQAVSWWCLLFVPVIPIRTYAVVDFKHTLPDGDDHSRLFRVRMDWSQVLFHVIFRIVAAIGTGVLIWFAVVHG